MFSLQGLERVVLLKLEPNDLYLLARARHLPAPVDTGREVEALHRAILDIVADLPKLIQTPGIQEATVALGAENDPVTLAYRIASLLNLTLDEEQQLLESSSRVDILRSLYAALSREVQILQLRDKIASDAREKIGKSQREYILREQLKAIQDELGETNSEGSEVDSLQKANRGGGSSGPCAQRGPARARPVGENTSQFTGASGVAKLFGSRVGTSLEKGIGRSSQTVTGT